MVRGMIIPRSWYDGAVIRAPRTPGNGGPPLLPGRRAAGRRLGALDEERVAGGEVHGGRLRERARAGSRAAACQLL